MAESERRSLDDVGDPNKQIIMKIMLMMMMLLTMLMLMMIIDNKTRQYNTGHDNASTSASARLVD